MKDDFRDPETAVSTLANGVRVIAMRLPHVETVGVSVFMRSGSQHESARLNGISHVVEHMAFKGTHERDCQQINLDAERLGADVNAHTDKDHTAFQMSGLGRDAGRFVAMLGDIVRHCTFPEAELERERQVILHEYLEDEDDALSTAYKLFDRTCFGTHPVGLERARNQIAVRVLRDRERPLRRLEDAAQDLFVHGRIRPRAEAMARIEAIDAETVRGAFERLLRQRPAIAIAGKLGKGVNERVLEIVEGRPAVVPKGRRVTGSRTRH